MGPVRKWFEYYKKVHAFRMDFLCAVVELE